MSFLSATFTSRPDRFWEKNQLAIGKSGTWNGEWRVCRTRQAQGIDGFGACFNELGWEAMRGLAKEARHEVLEAFFDPQGACRFNLCRLPIGANDFSTGWYSYNESPGDTAMEHFSVERDERALLPFVRAALEIHPGLRFWASPWCPPSWMKVSGRYASVAVNSNWGQELSNDSTDLTEASRLREEPEILAAYAQYFVRYIFAYQERGVRVEAVHLQNEVFANQIFPSCLWTKELFVRFIADFLHPAFLKAGLDTEIWAGTLNAPNREYAEWVLNHPRLRGILKGAGLQWGGKEILPGLRRPESLRVMQTESECHNGTNSWQTGMATLALLCHYFAHGANSFMYWNFALDEWGLSNWGWRQNSLVSIHHATGRIRWNPDFFMIRHFSGLVKLGARYLPSDPPPGLRAAAFVNPDGDIVAVAGNPENTATRVRMVVGESCLNIELPGHSVSTLCIQP